MKANEEVNKNKKSKLGIGDVAKELKRLDELKEKGLLTQASFKKNKDKLFS